MIYYGALFTEKELDTVFSEVQKAEKLYSNESLNAQSNILKELRKTDERFWFNLQNKTLPVCLYGINVTSIKDEEQMGEFKKMVAEALSSVFKKSIATAFYTIEDDDDE